MRKSQWLTFDLKTLNSYFQDLNSFENPLLEKYARMMKYNSPDEYEKIKNSLKKVSAYKEILINKIMTLYIEWVEEFAARFPVYSSMGRPLYSFQDSEEDTSIETYLRGELYSYSEKTLEYYWNHMIKAKENHKNLVIENMDNIAQLQGFKNSEDVEIYFKNK